MKVAVFGLGYVGVVTAACLWKEGHEVVGVDVDDGKVALVNSGVTPIIEEDMEGLVREGATSGRLRATSDAREAVTATDMGIVCVGTPSRPNGSLDSQHVVRVIREIGDALRGRTTPFSIVVRSTIVPGTLCSLLIPALAEASGRQPGEGYHVFFHPEFLREGTAVADFYGPPRILVGEYIKGTSALVMDIYGPVFDAPRITCEVEVAEMVKYCDNLFHALKVTFANEIGQICHELGVRGQNVMQIFAQDTKLNISSKYLMPGFAFGGSCLPKDLRAMVAVASDRGIAVPMIESVLVSNRQQIDRALRFALGYGMRRIGFYGLSFKQGTDDLRESPFVELAERLIGKGCKLTIYDQKVQHARLIGQNRSYVMQHLPHLADLLSDRVESLAECPLIVLCHQAPEQQVRMWLSDGKQVLDLSGQMDCTGDERFQSIV